MPRIYHSAHLQTGQILSLPKETSRHIQVLRMQPGDELTLFDGRGGEYAATIERMGKSDVHLQVGSHSAIEREAARPVYIAIGMPANERMEWLIEKATELGAASIQPLITERSVLRLNAEQAEKKRERWQQLAIAACEQCGRNQIPAILSPISYIKWLKNEVEHAGTAPLSIASETAQRAVLSLSKSAQSAAHWARQSLDAPLLCLAGPEGGLSEQEEQAAIAAGFAPVSLGAQTLRSETAPLAALALWTLQ